MLIFIFDVVTGIDCGGHSNYYGLSNGIFSMPPKRLAKVAASSTIDRLAPLSNIVRRRHTRLAGRSTPEVDAMESTASIREETVCGVREAKESLSSLLNEASFGDVFFIESGQGRPVVMVGADVLGEIFETLQNAQSMTLADAWNALPFKGSELGSLTLHGRPPQHIRLTSALLADKKHRP